MKPEPLPASIWSESTPQDELGEHLLDLYVMFRSKQVQGYQLGRKRRITYLSRFTKLAKLLMEKSIGPLEFMSFVFEEYPTPWVNSITSQKAMDLYLSSEETRRSAPRRIQDEISGLFERVNQGTDPETVVRALGSQVTPLLVLLFSKLHGLPYSNHLWEESRLEWYLTPENEKEIIRSSFSDLDIADVLLLGESPGEEMNTQCKPKKKRLVRWSSPVRPVPYTVLNAVRPGPAVMWAVLTRFIPMDENFAEIAIARLPGIVRWPPSTVRRWVNDLQKAGLCEANGTRGYNGSTTIRLRQTPGGEFYRKTNGHLSGGNWLMIPESIICYESTLPPEAILLWSYLDRCSLRKFTWKAARKRLGFTRRQEKKARLYLEGYHLLRKHKVRQPPAKELEIDLARPWGKE